VPSGKKSRAQRRTPPPVQAKRVSRPRHASPRVLIAIGGVVIAIALAVVLAVVLSGGSSHAPTNVPPVGSLANGLPGAADVNALFKGIPQKATMLGAARAPVTMVEYVDLQCPYCQQFETQVFPEIVRKYVRTGKLKVELRPWAFIGPDSLRGQAAVLAAGRQNRAFNYTEVLYDNQGTENTGWLGKDMVVSAAASIPGLGVPKLVSELDSAAVKAAAQRVDELAKTDHVNHTPTIFVGKSGQHGAEVKLNAPTDASTLVKAIRAALAGSPAAG
jgi:protein-disulfide isomerase